MTCAVSGQRNEVSNLVLRPLTSHVALRQAWHKCFHAQANLFGPRFGNQAATMTIVPRAAPSLTHLCCVASTLGSSATKTINVLHSL